MSTENSQIIRNVVLYCSHRNKLVLSRRLQVFLQIQSLFYSFEAVCNNYQLLEEVWISDEIWELCKRVLGLKPNLKSFEVSGSQKAY